MDHSPDILESAERGMSHKLFVRLQLVYSSLKTAEKKAADLILTQPAKVEKLNITEAATLACCSEATLTRFAKKLDFSGYPDLRAAISQNGDETPIFYENIESDDRESDIVRKVFMASMQAIEDSLNTIDGTQYEAAVDSLAVAGRILLAGYGDASTVALAAYLKFLRIGMDVIYTTDFDVQLIQASQLKKGDVVLAVSHTGRTETLVELVKCAKVSGAKIISITNFPVSPLAKQSDILLVTATYLQDATGEVMTKRIPGLCIVESLYISLARRNHTHTKEVLKLSKETLIRNKV